MSELHRVFGIPSDRISAKERHDQTRNIEDITRPKTPREIELTERLAIKESQLIEAREQARKAEEREMWIRGRFEALEGTMKLLEAPKADKRPWYRFF